MRQGSLLTWQFGGYPRNHTARATLAVHLATVPLFHAGLWLVVASPWIGWGWALGGVALLVVPVAAQGAMHRREPVAPEPFTGPADVVARLVAEQLVTFPRFVLTGGFARAWRGQGAP